MTTGTEVHEPVDLTQGQDTNPAGWRAFLLRWHQVHGDRRLTARQLWECPELGIAANWWDGTFPFPTGRPSAVSLGPAPVKSLGRWLVGQVDQWRGDVVLRSAREAHLNYRVYWVRHRPDTSPAAGLDASREPDPGPRSRS